MSLTTITSRASAALVAAVAGFASYRHIFDVATGAGEHRGVAAVLPLAIDGLILVATLAMLDDKRNHRHPRMSARVALVFGIASTLAANVASAAPTITARLVAAVPAVSFLLAVEVLSRTGKPRRDAVTQLADAPRVEVAPRPPAPASPRPDAPFSPAPVPTVRQPEPPAVTQLAALPEAPARRTREVVMRRPVSAPPADRDAAIAAAVQRVLTQDIPVRQAARDADLPEATLRRHVERVRAEQGDAPRVNGRAPNLTMQHH